MRTSHQEGHGSAPFTSCAELRPCSVLNHHTLAAAPPPTFINLPAYDSGYQSMKNIQFYASEKVIWVNCGWVERDHMLLVIQYIVIHLIG